MPTITISADTTLPITISLDRTDLNILNGVLVDIATGDAITGLDGPVRYFIGNAGTINAAGGNGIHLDGARNFLLNDFGGKILAAETAVSLNTGAGDWSYLVNFWQIVGGETGVSLTGHADSRISRIENLGLIEGAQTGIAAETEFRFLNGGKVLSDGTGLSMTGNAANSRVLNFFIIQGQDTGIEVSAADTFIGNAGKIKGAIGIDATNSLNVISEYRIVGTDGTAIRQVGDFTANLRNDGLIAGDVMLGDGTSVLRNEGLIRGTVDLGDGDDMYLAKGAGDVSGPVLGGAGNDRLVGANRRDKLIGGDDDDMLIGNGSKDRLIGGDGNDTLDGGEGNDLLRGGTGDDTLRGGDGRDQMIGSAGADILTGGADNDLFIFNKAADSSLTAFDKITDFTTGEDHLDLRDLVPGQIALDLLGSFSGTGPSAITVETPAGHTRVLIDMDGDGAADMRIDLLNATGLDAGDFLL